MAHPPDEWSTIMRPPALLAVELSNGHFMSCRLLYPDRNTLSYLNRWYRDMVEAILLIELGNLHSIQRARTTAMHRDWGELWTDHQPRFSHSWNHLKALARSLKVETLMTHKAGEWREINRK
ncbi:hypothetical protein [Endozoicomonas atrinae]|uniref:hypothetical protein n=1 Tax=Endozoicomonas atrinae TaxID=1333660 RepID=UPI000A83FDCB|nr:hypothetical protein [Endozoicomonas atrinae]